VVPQNYMLITDIASLYQLQTVVFSTICLC